VSNFLTNSHSTGVCFVFNCKSNFSAYIQNEVGNLHSKTVIVAAITSKTEKITIPTHIYINDKKCGLEKESLVLLEQIRTVDRLRLSDYRGSLLPTEMNMINKALSISVGLSDYE
jgi:mRNA interferase MazF